MLMDGFERSSDFSSLQLAGAVQKALLEDQMRELDCGNIAATNRMCDAVGGDFYYFNQLNEDQVSFAIGDVVGHGISAALVMSLIMGALRADQHNNSRPAQMVLSVNNMLVRLGERVNEHITCSMIYAVVDLPSRILFYVNAGHPEPIVANHLTRRISKLNPTTMLLGIQGGVRPESCHTFDLGDRLVLFTDGLTEAQNSREEPLGQQRFNEYINESLGANLNEFTDQLIERVGAFCGDAPGQDDQTLVVVDFYRK